MHDTDDERLERAREHCFLAGVGDTGMQLCEAVAPYGIAKIHHVQEKLGLPPDATFVGAPDATVTRNKTRWKQGFGYGGMTRWTGDFAVLDIKSNACGMLVGSLPSVPAVDDLRAIAARIERDGLELEGVKLDYDLKESNHFLDVFEVTPRPGDEPPPGGASCFFIMHSSGHENRETSKFGMGLYYDASKDLQRAVTVFDTPWGKLSVLTGADAVDWYETYAAIQAFNHRRREAMARALFGEFKSVSNETHQGLVRGINRANVGCYTWDTSDLRGGATETLFPLTLSADLPAYLVRGQPNFGADLLARLGWTERAERHGLTDSLRDTNLLPHGGGYKFTDVTGVTSVVQDGPDARRYELTKLGGGTTTIEHPRELAYTYRGVEVRDRLADLGLGKLVLELNPLYVL